MDYFAHLQKSTTITGVINNKADEIRTDISRRHHNPLSFCSVVERKYRLRDYFICGYAIEAASWFDTDAFQLWVKDLEANTYYLTFSQPEQNRTIGGTALNLTELVLPTPVGKAYGYACDLTKVKNICRHSQRMPLKRISRS